MSQREALLSFHGTLGADGEAQEQKRVLFGRLTDQRYLEEDRAEPKGGRDPNALASEIEPVSRTLTAESDDGVVGNTPFGSTEHPVLRVELLEAVVAAATRHSFDDADAFRSDPVLLRLARQLVADPVEASALLALIFEARTSEALQASQPRLLRADRDGSLFNQAAPVEGWQSTLSVVQTLADGSIELSPSLTSQPGAEPGAQCLARLVPVSIDGDGEYALSFRTTVDPVELPAPFQVDDFVAELFDPSNWPSRHPFWCSMQEEPPTDHAPAAPDLIAAMEQAQVVGEAAGASYGQRRVFREAVGTCSANGGQGTWPDTILVFADSHLAAPDGTTHHYLEYRLVPGASASLSLDDGTIQVVQNGTSMAITVTKMLYFKETEHSSQAELMAEYACLSGWADQTRLFLMNWLHSQ